MRFRSSGDAFTDGESYGVDLAATAGGSLSADDFAFANEKGFSAVARVRGMGPVAPDDIGFVGAAAGPETGTLALLGLGLAGLAAARRRKK